MRIEHSEGHHVCSAHAEVILGVRSNPKLPSRLLRTRGGDPMISYMTAGRIKSAPHTRR